MATISSFQKARGDRSLTMWLAPSGGALGITDIDVPTADELNNTGGVSGAVNATLAVSYNDTDLGFQASEQTNDPSWGDSATRQSLSTTNFGGSVSFYYPKRYDDASNPLSNVYDITDIPGAQVDSAIRIDGETSMNTPAANGDRVHTMRLAVNGEANPFNLQEDSRRTVSFLPRGDFGHYTIVGPHTLTPSSATLTGADGDKGRLQVAVQNRDYTGALSYQTSDVNVVDVYPGGYYTLTGTGTATITVSDEDAGTTTTIAVTVS